MAEQVVALDLGVTWNPNAPEGLLLSDGFGRTVLGLNPHHSDPDRRCVALVWEGARSASLADPNDEAISGHRLYATGLSQVLWAGVVRDSHHIRALEIQSRVHPRHDPSRFNGLTHYLIRLKECVAEVVAETIAVRRIEGTTLGAVTAAMSD